MRKAGIVSSKGLFRKFVIILLVFLLHLPGLAFAEKLTVMTRNLYLGAEIQSLAGAGSAPEFIAGVQEALLQIAANNFPERAVVLASEIVEKKPHLVGLQEVYNFTIDGGNTQPPFRDYLNDLMAALADQGASYYVAATVKNLDLALPIDGSVIGVMDRDVILAREDVAAEVVDLTPLCPPGRPSVDGCNYGIVAIADTPVGPIAFERGYVAVDTPYGRFFNTHLEIRDPDPLNPLSPLVQRSQAMELMQVIGALNSSNPPPGPIIIAGDFNSSPEDGDYFGFPSPYQQILTAGYTDAWTQRPGKPKGLTCCFDEDLRNPADLYERIDMIFSNAQTSRVKANVVGNDEDDLTPSGLWPSDHAGVVVRMEYAP